jgi:hypothetical protein
MTPLAMAGAVVNCHSGYAYAERPVTFHWEGERLEIRSIIAEWQTPVSKHFRISTIDERIFEIVYDLAGDVWEVIEKA